MSTQIAFDRLKHAKEPLRTRAALFCSEVVARSSHSKTKREISACKSIIKLEFSLFYASAITVSLREGIEPFVKDQTETSAETVTNLTNSRLCLSNN